MDGGAEPRGRIAASMLANAIVLVPLAFAAGAHATSPDLYHRSVQEDEALEWITFWAFALAAGRFALRGRAAGRAGEPWLFAGGLALLCAFVAGEEISWGQRLLAYRPPSYFLEHNFQQELNLHNVVDTDLRKLAFLAVTLGYGVLLPGLRGIGPTRGWLARLGVVAPPGSLVPAFATTAVVYAVYPWSHTGEWCEAMLGLGMLQAPGLAPGSSGTGHRALLRTVAAPLVAAGLGFATTGLWHAASGDDPTRSAMAETELRALRRDFAKARTRTRCGLHKRIYTVFRRDGQDHLDEGAFASLVTQGLPRERAGFFLDPWNSPYWIRHECSDDRRRRAIFVYSFGPNRLRDSTDWQVVPDDLGAWISRPEPAPGEPAADSAD